MINRANSQVIYVVVLISLPMLQKDYLFGLVFCCPWRAGHYGFFLMFLFSSPYLLAFPPSSVYFLSQSPNICHPPLSLAVKYLLFYPFLLLLPNQLYSFPSFGIIVLCPPCSLHRINIVICGITMITVRTKEMGV